MSVLPSANGSDQPETSTSTHLTDHQIAMIEEALACLGEYGEVRLVVERGRLRFVITQASHDVFKWTPGAIRRVNRA